MMRLVDDGAPAAIAPRQYRFYRRKTQWMAVRQWQGCTSDMGRPTPEPGAVLVRNRVPAPFCEWLGRWVRDLPPPRPTGSAV